MTAVVAVQVFADLRCRWPSTIYSRRLGCRRFAGDQLNTRLSRSFFGFFAYNKLLGRTKMRTRERKA